MSAATGQANVGTAKRESNAAKVGIASFGILVYHRRFGSYKIIPQMIVTLE